jgi:hypothetical protein
MRRVGFVFVSFLFLTPGTGNSGVVQHVADKRYINIFRPLFEIPSKLTSFAPEPTIQKNTETSSDSGLYIDIRRFGAYFSPNPPRTTARCIEGSSTVKISAPGDYQNGQGVVVYGCGSLPDLKTPATPTITPNLLNGTTTWNYRVIAEDYAGGYTAASKVGTSTAGPAELGLTSVDIAAATRSNGTSTYTTKSAHNLQPGAEVFFCGFGGTSCVNGRFADEFNGTKVVASVPSPETFTVNDGDVSDANERPSSAKVWVKACNTLTFGPGTASGYSRMLRYWIYRSRGGGLFALAGVAIGLDPYFVDCGGSAPSSPAYIPMRPPLRPGAGYLATVISSGGGTNSLELAAKAAISSMDKLLVHDNSSALLAAMKEAQNQSGGTIYIPSVSPGSAFWNFNASTDMTTVSGNNYTTILINGNVSLAQPWILRSTLRIEGMTKRNSSFMYPGGAHVGSLSGYPMFYAKKANSIVLRNLFVNCGGAQCTDLFTDTDGGGNGSIGVIIENVGFGNNSNGNVGTARNVIIKGGFDYFFRQVTCDPASGLATYLPAPCMNFTDSSAAVESGSQVAGRVKFENYYANGSGIRIDSIPNKNGSGPGGYYFNGVLAESMLTPFLRIGPIQQSAGDFHLVDLVMADQATGSGTPLVDATGARVPVITLEGGVTTQAGGQPIVIGSTGNGPTLFSIYQPTQNSGNTPWFAIKQSGLNSSAGAGAVGEIKDHIFNALGSSRFSYAMLPPPAPSSCVVSPGGKIPAGKHSYSLTAVDYDGGETLPGQTVNVNFTGAQTVTCALPRLPTGAAGFNVYRDGFRLMVGGTCQSPQVSINSFTDVGTGCGESSPSVNVAGSSYISRSGITTHKLRISGEILTASPRGILPAVLFGPLTSKWTAASWTPDKAVTITRVQIQVKSPPSGCSTNAIALLSDGAASIQLAITGPSNDSGPISQNYPAGVPLTFGVETPATGCSTIPADANAIIQYRMQ